MDEYPTWVGFVFVFNLVVGTGSLLLPKAFSETGWLLSSILIVFLAFTSFLTVTFVVEALSCSNAIVKWRRLQYMKREMPSSNSENDDEESEETDDDNEHRSLVDQAGSIESSSGHVTTSNFYCLEEKVELGEMSNIFFPSWGAMAVYLCLAVYLFGDLSIYCAVLSTTLRDVICDQNNTSNSTFTNSTLSPRDLPCWFDGSTATRFDVYRGCLGFFFVMMGPWVFFNVSKTKYLQFMTLSFRWLSFAIMIFIACHRIIFSPSGEIMPHPKEADFTKIPVLIGSLVYAFMCQHSLPSILIPIKEKQKIAKILSTDFFLIASLYLLLALTGVFAFAKLETIYTLNFIPKPGEDVFYEGIDYFLSLYPILTMTTSFPLVAITLRNNLQTLFVEKHQFDTRNFFIRRIIFPLTAITPPFLITFNTENVESLVKYTGGYGGTIIQYVIPVALVFYARRTCRSILGEGMVNEFRSRFQSNFWLVMLLSWTCISLLIVSLKLSSAN